MNHCGISDSIICIGKLYNYIYSCVIISICISLSCISVINTGHSTHATVSTTTKTIIRKDSVIPLASALSIRKIEEHCSSSSSIENHKPVQKLGR